MVTNISEWTRHKFPTEALHTTLQYQLEAYLSACLSLA